MEGFSGIELGFGFLGLLHEDLNDGKNGRDKKENGESIVESDKTGIAEHHNTLNGVDDVSDAGMEFFGETYHIADGNEDGKDVRDLFVREEHGKLEEDSDDEEEDAAYGGRIVLTGIDEEDDQGDKRDQTGEESEEIADGLLLQVLLE